MIRTLLHPAATGLVTCRIRTPVNRTKLRLSPWLEPKRALSGEALPLPRLPEWHGEGKR